ncbi:hypothetical protein LTR12_018119 [Friedmanniomyces endolithicus]|nr:hypothetical protein LTR12_018119 [Friedmanniomyces endolithicus]
MELRVSSKILSVASTFFKTMFESGFREALEPHFDLTPTQIPLPDDDRIALTTVCRVVHYRAREAPQALTADDLVRIEAICDKYDFTEALQMWSSSVLRTEIARADIDDMYKLLEAVSLLDSWEEYGQVLTQIILRRLGPCKHSPMNTISEEHVGHDSRQALEKSVEYLEAKRHDAIFAVIVAVEKAVSAFFWMDFQGLGHPGGVNRLYRDYALRMQEKLREIRGAILNAKLGVS